MIKPTIGRVVWFWESYMAVQREGAQPNAALVTFVHNDELVNLTVFSAVGYPGAYTHIPLWQGEGERPQGMHCEWMPYQKGQAAKVESGLDSAELEKRIALLEAQVKAALAYGGMAKAAVPVSQSSALPQPPLPPPVS